MRIRNNIMAMTAHRYYNKNLSMLARATERLSTGYRINRAADDPAGLAISEKMRAQIRGLNVASRNVQDSMSMLQVADGALQSAHNILHRMRELAVQAASDTNTDLERQAMDLEFQELIKELRDIADKTEFNGRKLLNGLTDFFTQSGPNQGDQTRQFIDPMNPEALGLEEGLNLLSRESASEAIGFLDAAVNAVSMQRASIGAQYNRLGHKLNNLENQAENLAAAESRIRDADIAKEMMEYAKYQILVQVGIAIMAQANALPQMILQLLPDAPGPIWGR